MWFFIFYFLVVWYIVIKCVWWGVIGYIIFLVGLLDGIRGYVIFGWRCCMLGVGEGILLLDVVMDEK